MRRKGQEDSFKAVLYAVGALVVVFLVYFWFVKEVDVFAVQVFDEDEVVVFEQRATTNVGSSLFQSLFGVAKLDGVVIQSSLPMDKAKKLVVFDVVVQAPSNNGVFKLDRVEYYKNDALVDVRGFSDFYLSKDESFSYSSEPFDLVGEEAQKNEVKLIFYFISENNEESTVEFVYEYLYVTRCESDADCPGRAPLCDRSNAARFSSQRGVFYCARPCGAHMDCAPGQICIVGVCGY